MLQNCVVQWMDGSPVHLHEECGDILHKVTHNKRPDALTVPDESAWMTTVSKLVFSFVAGSLN